MVITVTSWVVGIDSSVFCQVLHWPEVGDVVVENIPVPLTGLGSPEHVGVAELTGPGRVDVVLPGRGPGEEVEVPRVPLDDWVSTDLSLGSHPHQAWLVVTRLLAAWHLSCQDLKIFQLEYFDENISQK